MIFSQWHIDSVGKISREVMRPRIPKPDTFPTDRHWVSLVMQTECAPGSVLDHPCLQHINTWARVLNWSCWAKLLYDYIYGNNKEIVVTSSSVKYLWLVIGHETQPFIYHMI